MRTVVVTAQRSGKWWVLEAKEAGSVSQCRALSEVDPEMREAIAFQLGLPVDGFAIRTEVIPPEGFTEAMAQAEALTSEADLKARQAHAARVRAAKGLAAAHLSTRDIGAVMGISHQRAHQLLTTNL